MSTLFKLNSAVLELLILNIIAQKTTYGYRIFCLLKSIYPINESSIYTALKRLFCEEKITFDIQIINGKLRKYYTITSFGNEIMAKMNVQVVNELTSFLKLVAPNNTSCYKKHKEQ